MLLGVALLAGGAMAKPGIFDSYKALITELKCAEMPDNGTCAILFDEDDCDGWQLAVNEGYTELPDKTSFSLTDKPKKNDAEAVLVRDGCVFVGYDHNKEKGFENLSPCRPVTDTSISLLMRMV